MYKCQCCMRQSHRSGENHPTENSAVYYRTLRQSLTADGVLILLEYTAMIPRCENVTLCSFLVSYLQSPLHDFAPFLIVLEVPPLFLAIATRLGEDDGAYLYKRVLVIQVGSNLQVADVEQREKHHFLVWVLWLQKYFIWLCLLQAPQESFLSLPSHLVRICLHLGQAPLHDPVHLLRGHVQDVFPPFPHQAPVKTLRHQHLLVLLQKLPHDLAIGQPELPDPGGAAQEGDCVGDEAAGAPTLTGPVLGDVEIVEYDLHVRGCERRAG